MSLILELFIFDILLYSTVSRESWKREIKPFLVCCARCLAEISLIETLMEEIDCFFGYPYDS